MHRDSLHKMGPATYEGGSRPVEGNLHLTSDTLVFQPYDYRGRVAATRIPLSYVSRVTKCWTKFGPVPVFPNIIEVATTRGGLYRFIVMESGEEWRAAIAQLTQGTTATRQADDDLSTAPQDRRSARTPVRVGATVLTLFLAIQLIYLLLVLLFLDSPLRIPPN